MRRKDFNKQIEIYSVEPVADGYGGSTTTATLVDTRWAKIEPLAAGSALNEYGLQDATRSIVVTIRKNDLDITADHFIKYRGKTYSITSGPYELRFENKMIEFTAQEKIVKSNTAAP
jgi:SPP1 family predicted phage head-tail adaptor